MVVSAGPRRHGRGGRRRGVVLLLAAFGLCERRSVDLRRGHALLMDAHRTQTTMARLLLVDDDPDQVNIWTLLLEASGHQIERAGTVPRAIEKLAVEEPDILLM